MCSAEMWTAPVSGAPDRDVSTRPHLKVHGHAHESLAQLVPPIPGLFQPAAFFLPFPIGNMFGGKLSFDWKAYGWALFYCAIASIGSLCYGYDNTYYNGVLAMQEFKNDYGDGWDGNGQRILSSSFQSLTASSIYIGDLLGAIIAAPINDRWGRKAVFWFASMCIMAGGIAQVADTHHEAVIFVGRIMIGLGVGQFTVTSLLYIGEVVPASIRGPALMTFQFLQSWAQFIAGCLTYGTETIPSTLSYKLPMGGLIILPLMMFLGLPFIPETPSWYILKGRRADAEKSLRKINRKAGYDPASDIALLEAAKAVEETHKEGASSFLSIFTDPVERRKLIIATGSMFHQQIGGITFFYVYGVVFAQAIGLNDPFLIQLITNILQIVAVGASVATGNKIRRRINLLVTNSMMLVALVIIGAIGAQKTLTTSYQYVIVVFTYMVVVGFNFGAGPLAYTVAREVSVGPNQNRIMSAAIVSFYFWTWFITFTAPYLYYDANLGPMVGFVYAGGCCIALAYVWFFVGETTGRTNLEISIFFTEKVPVRKWKTHAFPVNDSAAGEKSGLQEDEEHRQDADVEYHHQEVSQA